MKIEHPRYLKVKPKKIRPVHYCRECNSQLGYFITPSNRKCFWFSEKPFIIDTVEYYRSLCIDCFKSKTNRLPVSPNVINKDMPILLEIPLDIFNKIKTSRFEHNFFTKKARQLKEDKEWKAFLSYKNTYEYKRDKYGWTREKFDEFNKSRAITLENLIKKHGEEQGTLKYNTYCKRQAYAGNSLEYFIEKYGQEKGIQEYKRINSQKAITIENMQRIHGIENGNKIYEKWLRAERLGTKYYSAISQELFWLLYNQLPDKNEIKFAEYNKEQFLWNNKIAYAYDFKYKNKIIEFNGEHCHPNIERLTKAEFGNWRDCYSGKSAEERIEEDTQKILTAKNAGFKVLVLWYYDYMNYKENTIKRALEFLKEV